VGVAGLTDVLQDRLFDTEPAPDPPAEGAKAAEAAVLSDPESADVPAGRSFRRWLPGADVFHADHGPGWVWGSGLGRVTVRFETRDTPPGPVRTFPDDDPALSGL
jgi:DNA polymerase-4